MAGVDVVTIQTYMGHSDLATTRRYLHHAPAPDEAARIGAAFAQADPRIAQVAASDPETTMSRWTSME